MSHLTTTSPWCWVTASAALLGVLAEYQLVIHYTIVRWSRR